MKTVLHSVSYAGLWPGQVRLSLEDTLRKAAKLGFSGVEIVAKRPHLSPNDYDADRVKNLRELLDSLELECACLAAYTNFTGGAESAEVPFGEMQVLYLSRLAEIAKTLGCPRIRVFTAYRRSDMTYAEQWQRCVTLLRECALRAGEHGVTIGIQNHHDLAVTAVEMKALIEEIGEPNVKAFLDAWAPALQRRNLRDEVRIIGDLIDFTTVADYQPRPRFRYLPGMVNYERCDDAMQAVPMGEGIVDYKTFFSALQEVNYSGPISYEMCSPLVGGGSEENLDRYCRAFHDYMQRLGLVNCCG